MLSCWSGRIQGGVPILIELLDVDLSWPVVQQSPIYGGAFGQQYADPAFQVVVGIPFNGDSVPGVRVPVVQPAAAGRVMGVDSAALRSEPWSSAEPAGRELNPEQSRQDGFGTDEAAPA